MRNGFGTIQTALNTKNKLRISKPLGVGEGQSELSILVVKDMLLTGFDAPVAQVMYLDRKLSTTLFQAIARVNRTNKNKFGDISSITMDCQTI